MVALLPFIICLYQTKLARTGGSGNCSLGFRLVYHQMDSVFSSLCTWSLPSKLLHLSGLSLFLCFVIKPLFLYYSWYFLYSSSCSVHTVQAAAQYFISVSQICAEFPSPSMGLDVKFSFCLRILFPLPFTSSKKTFLCYYFTFLLGLSPQSTPKHFTYSVQESVEGECIGALLLFLYS